jgi:cytochrome c oxidase cbb3-type subunit 3
MDIKDNEHKMLIEDHDYDGIKELDNNPPPWIMWILYITIFWSAFYLAVFHVLKIGDLQETEYIKEIEKANIQKELISQSNTFDEENILLLESETDLNAGKELFISKTCVTCHGNLGEGNAIGPNLTDEYWLLGSSPSDVFKTIKYGNSIKGMTAFKDQLTDANMQQLTSYILVKLQGTNPPNAKEPQGEKK